MKKFLLILFAVIIHNFVFSQEKALLVSNKNTLGLWNKSQKRYDFDNFIYSKINFNFYEDRIIVSDVNQSKYYIFEKKEIKKSNLDLVCFLKCLDEEKRDCEIKLYDRKKNPFIMIIYTDRIFVYYINRKIK